MGKDNIPFHTVIFTATLLVTGDPYTLLYQLSTTEYLNYEDGKFCKSRKVGVFGDDCLDLDVPSEIFRYYLLINRPEQGDSIFSWQDFQDKVNNDLLKNLGNFINRVLKFSFKYSCKAGELLKEDMEIISQFHEKTIEYCSLMEGCNLKQGLKQVIEMSSLGNKFLQD